MGMVVQCNSCMTEYRLNEALLKGAKGACIRCPKCRERIFIENPQARPVSLPRMSRVAPPAASPDSLPKVPPPALPAVVEAVTTPIHPISPVGRRCDWMNYSSIRPPWKGTGFQAEEKRIRGSSVRRVGSGIRLPGVRGIDALSSSPRRSLSSWGPEGHSTSSTETPAERRRATSSPRGREASLKMWPST